MIHVFYHRSDNDGKASGAIIKKYLLGNKLDFIMHPLEYGDKFPESIPTEDELIFADVVVSPYEGMADVINKYPNLTVIDHHKSFIEWLNGQTYVPRGIRKTNRSACYLCWEFFFPDTPVPQIIELLSDYDTWNQTDEARWENEILPFQSGIKTLGTDPVDNWNLWETLFMLDFLSQNYWIEDIIKAGQIVLDYQYISNSGIMKSNAFEASFDGLNAICCNTNFRNSQSFESIWDENKYHLMIAFDINKVGEFKVSLYTTRKDVDLSKIARSHGGGGHSQAAGFTANNMSRKENEIIFS